MPERSSRQGVGAHDDVLLEIEREHAAAELDRVRRRNDLELFDLESEVRHRHEMRAQAELRGTIRLLRLLVLTALLLTALILLLIEGPGGLRIVQLLVQRP